MKRAPTMNDIQVILNEFLGNRKAVILAESIFKIIQQETKHSHNGKNFYVHEDESGELVLTTESKTEQEVRKLLTNEVNEVELEEAISLIFDFDKANKEHTSTNSSIEMFHVEGSDSPIYGKLLEFNPEEVQNENSPRCASIFLERLEEAVMADVEPFDTPVCDLSITDDGKPCFEPGCVPAVGMSYAELDEFARKNNLTIGNNYQYTLFVGMLISKLVEQGWTMRYAFYNVCMDSKKLGNYSRKVVEHTGSKKIVGKCDLSNVRKIIANYYNDKHGFWMASGYDGDGSYPISVQTFHERYGHQYRNCVGWFVFPESKE